MLLMMMSDVYWMANLTYTTQHVHTGDGNSPTRECVEECLWLTGFNGTWIQDWDFAEKHGQYSSPIAYPLGPFGQRTVGRFKPSADAPYPWPTSWKWMDHNKDCQINVMSHEKLCTVLIKLKVRRVLFYGDSLTQGMYESFMNLIGHVRGVDGYRGSFVCKSSNQTVDGHVVVDVFHKRDSGGNAFPHSPRGVYEIDSNITSFICNSTDRVLGIFNIGAHYHNFSHYQEDLDIMLLSLSDLARPQDIYFFRATSPGHDNCCCKKGFNWTHGTRIAPMKSSSDYSLIEEHKYSWDKFEAYNAYTQKLLLLFNQNESIAPFHFLNIYNMTLLRHDAHGEGDCLHFTAPGPVDWWNHLLFTNLLHLSQHRGGNCRMSE